MAASAYIRDENNFIKMECVCGMTLRSGYFVTERRVRVVSWTRNFTSMSAKAMP